MKNVPPHLAILSALPVFILITALRSPADIGAGRPGNVFLSGEPVQIPIKHTVVNKAGSWRMLDDRSETVARGEIDPLGGESVSLGRMDAGWYRIEFIGGDGERVDWTTAAIVEPLKAPTPADSPICVDAAMSWLARDGVQRDTLARLASLAGVNWIRDRLRWRDIQPKPTYLRHSTVYDAAAVNQHRFGLRVLQVFHDTPPWAAGYETVSRFPRDLRHAYRFCRAMAERYGHFVEAWEPWNEANIELFGGHTVDEMCAYQKAAWLGFKDGNPNAIVGWNVSAGVPAKAQTRGVLLNETAAYFDTYNIHTYDWPSSYFENWKPVREAASGKPLWITESDRGTPYATGGPEYEQDPVHEIRKAEFMAQSYASSLYAGAERHFHFILGHYVETHHGVQFGLLRRDLTPRPAYAALAALGRLLAGAECLGRYQPIGSPLADVFAFRAFPDGKERDVLVAWAEEFDDWDKRGNTRIPSPIPETVHAIESFDYLGRRLEKTIPAELSSAPVFIVLPPGGSDALPLKRIYMPSREYPPASRVVIQFQVPREQTATVKETPWSEEHVYAFPAGGEIPLVINAYNFSDGPVAGSISLQGLPEGWSAVDTEWKVSIQPMERTAAAARLNIPAGAESGGTGDWIRAVGRFEEAETAYAACRILVEPPEEGAL